MRWRIPTHAHIHTNPPHTLYHVHTHAHLHSQIHTYARTNTSTHPHTHINSRTHSLTHAFTYTQTHTLTDVHTNTHTQIAAIRQDMTDSNTWFYICKPTASVTWPVRVGNLQHAATCCNALQHTATHCTLQHTATHCSCKRTPCAWRVR